MPSPEPRETLNRRRAERDALALAVLLRFDASDLAATTADLSPAGSLLTVSGDVRVEVDCGPDHGGVRIGRLVRSAPIGGGRLALAIEFLDPSADRA